MKSKYSVGQLELSVRGLRVLEDAGISTVEALTTLTEDELIQLICETKGTTRFYGKELRDIKDALDNVGLSLKELQ